jgi:hypothetical protein
MRTSLAEVRSGPGAEYESGARTHDAMHEFSNGQDGGRGRARRCGGLVLRVIIERVLYVNTDSATLSWLRVDRIVSDADRIGTLR